MVEDWQCSEHCQSCQDKQAHPLRSKGLLSAAGCLTRPLEKIRTMIVST
jgi:hypothetical protein